MRLGACSDAAGFKPSVAPVVSVRIIYSFVLLSLRVVDGNKEADVKLFGRSQQACSKRMSWE